MCQSPGCPRPSTVADHVENLAEGGAVFGQLQALCQPCHDAKTQAEAMRGRTRYRGPETGRVRWR